jgi:hypothetical protein
MQVEFLGEISNQSLNSKSRKDNDDYVEESLLILVKAKEYPEIAGLSSGEIERYLETGLFSNFNIGKASTIIKGVFNLDIAGFNFIGQKFTSGSVGLIKDSGICIKLHVNLPFNKEFHAWIPNNYRTMLKIKIWEVNEQLEIEPSEE